MKGRSFYVKKKDLHKYGIDASTLSAGPNPSISGYKCTIIKSGRYIYKID